MRYNEQVLILVIQEYSIVSLYPFTWQITSSYFDQEIEQHVFKKKCLGIQITLLILNSDLYSLMLADAFLDLEQNNSLARNENSTDVSKNTIIASSHW